MNPQLAAQKAKAICEQIDADIAEYVAPYGAALSPRERLIVASIIAAFLEPGGLLDLYNEDNEDALLEAPLPARRPSQLRRAGAAQRLAHLPRARGVRSVTQYVAWLIQVYLEAFHAQFKARRSKR